MTGLGAPAQEVDSWSQRKPRPSVTGRGSLARGAGTRSRMSPGWRVTQERIQVRDPGEGWGERGGPSYSSLDLKVERESQKVLGAPKKNSKGEKEHLLHKGPSHCTIYKSQK